MGKVRIITLTQRAPVKIDEDAWKVIASASDKDYDGEYEFRANQISKWDIVVRVHGEDGRVIVSATYSYSSNWRNSRNYSAKRGVLLVPTEGTEEYVKSQAAIVAAINEVVSDIQECEHDDEDAARWNSLRDECIADLPAEVL